MHACGHLEMSVLTPARGRGIICGGHPVGPHCPAAGVLIARKVSAAAASAARKVRKLGARRQAK
jgi:hypothetical protein